MDDENDSVRGAKPPRGMLKQVRMMLWLLAALAALGFAALLLVRRDSVGAAPAQPQAAQASFGGAFTLTGADGKSFSSSRLNGKPFAIFFGFTRCGDVCPTTLGRLVKLRDQAGDESDLNIVFVTIDPENDGPEEVGQYAKLFNSPIIGLTGTDRQIDQVKKQYGIHAEPNPGATGHGDMIAHTSRVLLFGPDGKFAGSIAPDDPDSAALDQIRRLV